jgi:hypothetical protein
MGWLAVGISASSTSSLTGLCTPESPLLGAPSVHRFIQFEAEERGKSDREAAAASSQVVQDAPADFDAYSSDSESGSPFRSVYHSSRESRSGSFVEQGGQSIRHSA